MSLGLIVFLIFDSADIFDYRGKRRDRAGMTAYNFGRSSQTGGSSTASSVSESDRASEYSVDSSAESERYRRGSDTQGTENSEQTENERLRYKVKSLRTELHKTMDYLEHAHCAVARQKRLTELKLSIVVSGLGGGRYAGYENGRVINSWDRKQREAVEGNVAQYEAESEREKRRLEAIRQAAQQGNGARIWKAGLDAWCVAAPHNPSARRRLI